MKRRCHGWGGSLERSLIVGKVEGWQADIKLVHHEILHEALKGFSRFNARRVVALLPEVALGGRDSAGRKMVDIFRFISRDNWLGEIATLLLITYIKFRKDIRWTWVSEAGGGGGSLWAPTLSHTWGTTFIGHELKKLMETFTPRHSPPGWDGMGWAWGGRQISFQDGEMIAKFFPIWKRLHSWLVPNCAPRLWWNRNIESAIASLDSNFSRICWKIMTCFFYLLAL